MKVLITGSAGFIGSHLTKFYLSRGDKVVGIDNFCTSDCFSKHVVEHEKHKNYKHYGEDLSYIDESSNYEHTIYKLIDFCPDLILNFACPASPKKYQDLSVETIEVCSRGMINVLEIARICKSRIVHASTSEIYGDPSPSHKIQNENYWGNVNPYGPRGCYDNGKRLAESLCYEYRNKYGVDTRIVRIFNTYGPLMDSDDGRVVSNFICQALRENPLTVYGDGCQTRSFCYIDDLVDGITRLSCLIDNDGTPINLGNPDEFTINELVNHVVRLTGTKSKIVNFPLPADDPHQRNPDISKAKLILNWSPKTDLLHGLKSTISYFEELLLSKSI